MIRQLFRKLLEMDGQGLASIELFRSRFAVTLILAGCSFLLLFGTLDWLAGLHLVAVADMLLIAALLLAAFYMQKSYNVETGIRRCIMALFIWFVVTLPSSILIILWLPIFPLAAFFGLGRKEGMRWSLIFLLVVAAEFVVCRINGIFIAENLFLLSTVASLALIVLTVFFYQRLLEIFDEALQVQSQQLQQAQKMESVGLLAGGVAHDFNNLLVGVMGNAELAMMSLDENHPVQEHLNGMMTSAQRGADLVRQMLAFAGKGGWQREHLNINSLIEETQQLMGVAIGGKADLAYELADTLPTVHVDSTQVQQMLVNLLVNAVEAASPERYCQIVIRSGQTDCLLADFESFPINFTEHAGSYVYVQVCDNGLGMDDTVQARIFDPFFTTKEAGTGLGLAATAGTLRSLGGALSLKSQKGSGSEITLWLPAVAEQKVNTNEATKDNAKPAYHFNWNRIAGR